MIVGFTGSRDGMTRVQLEMVKSVLATLKPDEGHHGDCVGADEGFHEACRERGGVHIVVHPPMGERLRAFCEGDKILQPKGFIGRNRDIVEAVNVLIACPKQELEPKARELRGHGTWSTVRYATGRVPINLISPSGKLEVR